MGGIPWIIVSEVITLILKSSFCVSAWLIMIRMKIKKLMVCFIHYIFQIFPVNIKGSAGSLVNLIKWTSSWIVAYTFTFLFEWNSAGDSFYYFCMLQCQPLVLVLMISWALITCAGTFFIFAIFGVAGVVFVAKLVPETKGRTLEEIQALVT